MFSMPKRYKDRERYMAYALCADTVFFILYLIFAGIGIIWLKVVCTIFCMLLSAFLLGYLYMTKELLKRRSLWLSTGAAAIAVCILFSLILNFPSPNKYKPQNEENKSASCIIELH